MTPTAGGGPPQHGPWDENAWIDVTIHRAGVDERLLVPGGLLNDLDAAYTAYTVHNIDATLCEVSLSRGEVMFCNACRGAHHTYLTRGDGRVVTVCSCCAATDLTPLPPPADDHRDRP